MLRSAPPLGLCSSQLQLLLVFKIQNMEQLWPRFRDPSRQVKFQELPLLPVETLHRLTLKVQKKKKQMLRIKGLNSVSSNTSVRAVLLYETKSRKCKVYLFQNQMEHAKTRKHKIFSYASQWLYRYLLYRFEHLIRQNVWGCKKYFLQKHRDQVMETPQNTKRQRYKGIKLQSIPTKPEMNNHHLMIIKCIFCEWYSKYELWIEKQNHTMSL